MEGPVALGEIAVFGSEGSEGISSPERSTSVELNERDEEDAVMLKEEGGVVEGVGVVLSTRRLQRKGSMVHIKGPAQDEHAADEDDGANNFFGE